MAQKHRRDSFLKNAAATDDGLFLGINRLPSIPKTVEDELVVLSSAYDERPDLYANELYGNSRLWWVFSLRNPDVLKDPIRDFKAGTKIIVPPRSAIQNLTVQ